MPPASGNLAAMFVTFVAIPLVLVLILLVLVEILLVLVAMLLVLVVILAVLAAMLPVLVLMLEVLADVRATTYAFVDCCDGECVALLLAKSSSSLMFAATLASARASARALVK